MMIKQGICCKNVIYSGMYGTQGYSWTDAADVGSPIAAYDYRAFGEQVSLAEPSDKVTENFTGKERDDETELDYFGARYLDPMLGMWISVDPMRQFASPYLYAGNGYNPVNAIDPDGNEIEAYLIVFRISAGVGINLGLGYVRNTENSNDCGIMFSIGLGTGVEVGVLPNTVPSTLAQGVVNSMLDKSSIQNAHDLEGIDTEIHVGLGAGAKLNGNGEYQSSEIGAVGGGVYINKTSVFTLEDLLGDKSTSLLPTSGPAPADNLNVAVPNLKLDE